MRRRKDRVEGPVFAGKSIKKTYEEKQRQGETCSL